MDLELDPDLELTPPQSAEVREMGPGLEPEWTPTPLPITTTTTTTMSSDET